MSSQSESRAKGAAKAYTARVNAERMGVCVLCRARGRSKRLRADKKQYKACDTCLDKMAERRIGRSYNR